MFGPCHYVMVMHVEYGRIICVFNATCFKIHESMMERERSSLICCGKCDEGNGFCQLNLGLHYVYKIPDEILI